MSNDATANRIHIAGLVTSYAEVLASRADIISEKLGAKLHTVMLSEDAAAPIPMTGAPSNYPQLFAMIHNALACIDVSLNKIEDTLERTEL